MVLALNYLDALLKGKVEVYWKKFHDQMSNIFSTRRIMIHAEGGSDDL